MSAQQNITKLGDVDFKNLKFTNVRSKTGRRFINVYYDKKVLQIALPKLRLPFNSQLSRFGALEFNLSLDQRETLIKSFENLDNEMLLFAEKNEWFKDKEFSYIPVLKKSDNDRYPPTIKLKIAKKDGGFVTKIYNENKEPIKLTNDSDALDVLQKGNQVISLVECAGVWFNTINGVETFGVFWKVDHLRVYPPLEKKEFSNGYMFEDSDQEVEDYAFEE